MKRTFDQDGAGGTYSPVDEYFAYDGKEAVLRWSGGFLKNRYLNGPAADQILADEQLHGGGELLWPLADNLGTVRDLVNNSDVIRNHVNYDAFGNVVSETGASYDHIGGFQSLFRDEGTASGVRSLSNRKAARRNDLARLMAAAVCLATEGSSVRIDVNREVSAHRERRTTTRIEPVTPPYAHNA